MNPPIDTIRLGKQSRDQLTKIKRSTGIENWNIICRWAFCVSLREPTLPSVKKFSSEDGVEISWRVFAGEHAKHFACLLTLSAPVDADLGAHLHGHLRRGLGYLASAKNEDIDSFLRRWS